MDRTRTPERHGRKSELEDRAIQLGAQGRLHRTRTRSDVGPILVGRSHAAKEADNLTLGRA
jgi:hypothetical protein